MYCFFAAISISNCIVLLPQHQFVATGPSAPDLRIFIRGAFGHHFYRLPNQSLVYAQGLPVLHVHQLLQPGMLYLVKNLLLHPRCRGTAAF